MSNRHLLKIANCYGNVDTRTGIPKRYTHIPGKRLQPLCRKLGIKYAEAFVGFKGSERKGYKPEIDGVVVSTISAPKLLKEIEERTQRNPPEKREAAKRNRKRREQARCEKEQHEIAKLGIDPFGMVAKWYREGEVDQFTAQLISFKTAYRHEFTDYDIRIEKLMRQARAEVEKSHLRGEDRRFEYEMARDDARLSAVEEPIPDNWNDYLRTYPFPNASAAKRLAEVLQEPTQAHPVWFCKACIAVTWAKLDLSCITYEEIVQAIADWRDDQYES